VGCGVNILNHKDLLSSVVLSAFVRILLDYRPALRERTGVGEFVHQLTKALATDRLRQQRGDEIAILCTSWTDRPAADLATELPGVDIIDRRVPVRALTWTWNRVGWPPVEWLAGTADVVHSQTPLLIPSRRAAQVVTIHDLDFLSRPDRARAEMRRDFPALVHDHARRADQIVVSSQYTAREVVRQLGVPAHRVTVCASGAPAWARDVARQRAAADLAGSTILFVGTVDARKNVSGLLDAYAALRSRRWDVPPLVIAGRVAAPAAQLVDRVKRPPLDGAVQFRGYVPDEERPALYRHARMLVLPSFEEGFGLPVLEAMACGVPVVISDRGSLPEVAGAAATPVPPDDIEGLAAQMEYLLDGGAARTAISRGHAQAAKFSWEGCAHSTLDAYREAIRNQAGRLA
jgi:glycosyltransferase involved in cell wall biosynthesis